MKYNSISQLNKEDLATVSGGINSVSKVSFAGAFLSQSNASIKIFDPSSTGNGIAGVAEKQNPQDPPRWSKILLA